QLQEVIEHREAALRTMVDTVQALLLVLDENCSVIQANPAVAHATGLPLEDIIGSDWLETVVPPHQHELAREVFHSLREHKGGASLETAVLRRGPLGELEERTVSWRLAGLSTEGQ